MMRGMVLHGVIISRRRIFRSLVMGFLKVLIIRGGILIAFARYSMKRELTRVVFQCRTHTPVVR